VSLGRAAPLVLSAPSGTGKTTLAHRLVDGPGPYTFSVSVTTRPPRGAETDGIDYHFVDRDAFVGMVRRGALVEWAEVHGRLYGTPRDELDEAAERGLHAVLDIDVQGARQVRERVPDARLVFVLPPSVDALVERLGGRGTEEATEMERRLRGAIEELDAVEVFDHVVVNDDLDRCLAEVDRLVRGERGNRTTSGSVERARSLREELERRMERTGPGPGRSGRPESIGTRKGEST